MESKQREGSAKTLNVIECVCLLGGSVNVLRDIGGILYAPQLLSFCHLSSLSYRMESNVCYVCWKNAKRTNTAVGSISPLLCEASEALGNTI